MWAAVVARDGVLCAIARSGNGVGDQWPASRGIAMAKAFTANGLSPAEIRPLHRQSVGGLAARRLPLWRDHRRPARPDCAVCRAAAKPMARRPIPRSAMPWAAPSCSAAGCALYSGGGMQGALGASGDTSCADHNVAWRVRHALNLDKVPGGPSAKHNDAIIYDVGGNGKSAPASGTRPAGTTRCRWPSRSAPAPTAAPPPK